MAHCRLCNIELTSVNTSSAGLTCIHCEDVADFMRDTRAGSATCSPPTSKLSSSPPRLGARQLSSPPQARQISSPGLLTRQLSSGLSSPPHSLVGSPKTQIAKPVRTKVTSTVQCPQCGYDIVGPTCACGFKHPLYRIRK